MNLRKLISPQSPNKVFLRDFDANIKMNNTISAFYSDRKINA